MPSNFESRMRLVTPGRLVRRAVSVVVLLAIVAFDSQLVSAEKPDGTLKVDVLTKGDSTKATRRTAISQVPLEKLPQKQAEETKSIIENCSLFRRLPAVATDADPRAFQFFITKPEAAVEIWKVLKISQFQLTPMGERKWKGKTQDGSQGSIELIFATKSQQIYVCDGEYKNPLLLRPIQAKAVMHLRTQTKKNPDGSPRLVHNLDLFVEFPNQAIETVAKVIAPISYVVADRNFRELSLFVEFMSAAMCRQPGWVERVVQRMNLLPVTDRQNLLRVAAQVYVSGRKRNAGKTSAANPINQPVTTLIEPYRTASANKGQSRTE